MNGRDEDVLDLTANQGLHIYLYMYRRAVDCCSLVAIPTLSLITSMLRSEKNCMSDALQCCVTHPMKFGVGDSSVVLLHVP